MVAFGPEVNSSGKAFNVLETLRRLGPSLLRRKRQRLQLGKS